MTEQKEDSMPVGEPSEPAQPEPSTPPPKGGKKLWVVIVAVVVAILLISTALFVMLGGDEAEYEATMTADGEEVDSLELLASLDEVELSIEVTKDGESLIGDSGLSLRWSVSDDSLGSFNVKAQPTVEFTAGSVEGTGVLNCSVTYTKNDKVVFSAAPSIDISVGVKALDAVIVVPSTKTLPVDGEQVFKATPINSVAEVVPGATITWSVTGIDAGDYTLSATTGSTVTFSSSVLGDATLTATAVYEDLTVAGSASVIVSETMPGDSRTVDYYWYDMFETPFYEWWDLRWSVYKTEEPISEEYPYMFIWYGSLPGNTWIYTNIRLNITGEDMPDLNMNERPEFLPLLGYARGGNADIDWYMQYLTTDEMARYPANTAAWSDGWVISLNGTVTLDKTAAMAVLNITQSGWDRFDKWWNVRGSAVEQSFSSWLTREAGKARLDIFNMYEYPLTILTWDLTAQKVGETVVLKYDLVTWGMEALMTRWMHESFMSTEWYFEDMYFRAHLGPEASTVDIDAVAVYSSYAYEATLDAAPCWSWEALLQDYVAGSIAHPASDFDPYSSVSYWNFGPGSWWYGAEMDYDYTPGVFNLAEGETLAFTWPDDEVLFPVHVENDPDITSDNRFTNVSGTMTVEYGQPIASMDPEYASQIVLDTEARLLTYTGPFDFMEWGETQTTHENLTVEWDRIDLLPWGLPFVEFVLDEEPYPDSFGLELLANAKATQPVDVEVTCLDQRGRVYTDYVGTVTFSSDDSGADLPDDYKFVEGDEGVHTFTVTFSVEGQFSLTVEDSANESIVGTIDVDVLAPPVLSDLRFEDVPDYAVSGVAFTMSVEAVDQYGDVFAGYTGTVTFTSNDTDGGVVLPDNYPFDVADNGVKDFPDGFTLVTVGWYAVNVTDTVDDTLTDEIMLWVFEPAADHLAFDAGSPTTVYSSAAFSLTVTAYDSMDNVYKPYDGTVTFSSTDAGGISLPEDYPFVPATDMGTHVFQNEFVLVTEGSQDVTVEDTVDATLTDTVTVEVMPAMREVTHTIYDLFEEPFHEWWYPRWPNYGTDVVYTNTPSTFMYWPGRDDYPYQGMMMAPYRYNLTGMNLTTISMENPEFMPSIAYLGTSALPGAEADIRIYMQYIDQAWLDGYWTPSWGVNSNLLNNNDGYYLATLYNVRMNRPAAEMWLNLPVSTEDVDGWWTTNNGTYTATFSDWIDFEGNYRLDIFCGYEWAFEQLDYKFVVREDPGTGDILLDIGYVTWGYETLITRWLTDAGITPHQPWFEDFELAASYVPGKADIEFDGVCQWSMFAVEANGTDGDAAWVWQPTRMDYITWGTHPSDFELYEPLLYTSHNAADSLIDTPVPYDTTPQWMNLTDHETLVIVMPTGEVPGFQGVGLTSDDYFTIADTYETWIADGMPASPLPDFSSLDAIRADGTMSPGFILENYPTNTESWTYDSEANTLKFEGPLTFDNFRHSPDGALYHSAPWIEMDVTSAPAAAASSAPSVPTDGSGAATGTSAASEMVMLAVALGAVAMVVVALGVGARRRDL